MSENDLVMDYNIKIREKNSLGVNYKNRMSLKRGENPRKLSVAISELFLEMQQPEKVQEWYLKGLYDRGITNQRKAFIESDGIDGISRSDALKRYKLIRSKLLPGQFVFARTFDGFTEEDFK